ncbi:hypothetical protein IWQ61_003403 [Dispira simplex]|nr:hypothetical protein IWQ61_003403 [Dispira simplex]
MLDTTVVPRDSPTYHPDTLDYFRDVSQYDQDVSQCHACRMAGGNVGWPPQSENVQGRGPLAQGEHTLGKAAEALEKDYREAKARGEAALDDAGQYLHKHYDEARAQGAEALDSATRTLEKDYAQAQSKGEEVKERLEDQFGFWGEKAKDKARDFGHQAESAQHRLTNKAHDAAEHAKGEVHDRATQAAQDLRDEAKERLREGQSLWHRLGEYVAPSDAPHGWWSWWWRSGSSENDAHSLKNKGWGERAMDDYSEMADSLAEGVQGAREGFYDKLCEGSDSLQHKVCQEAPTVAYADITEQLPEAVTKATEASRDRTERLGHWLSPSSWWGRSSSSPSWYDNSKHHHHLPEQWVQRFKHLKWEDLRDIPRDPRQLQPYQYFEQLQQAILSGSHDVSEAAQRRYHQFPGMGGHPFKSAMRVGEPGHSPTTATSLGYLQPPHAPVTGLYGSVIAIYFIILSRRLWSYRGQLSERRRSLQRAIGLATHGVRTDDTVPNRGHKEKPVTPTAEPLVQASWAFDEEYESLSRSIAALSQFTALVPVTALLLLFMEINGYSKWLLHSLFLGLVAAAYLTHQAEKWNQVNRFTSPAAEEGAHQPTRSSAAGGAETATGSRPIIPFTNMTLSPAKQSLVGQFLGIAIVSTACLSCALTSLTGRVWFPTH